MACAAEFETGSAKEGSLVIVEPGEYLQFEQLTDITGDPDRSGGRLSIETQVHDHQPVVERTLDLEDLARGRPGCLESGQVRFTLSAAGRPGKDVLAAAASGTLSPEAGLEACPATATKASMARDAATKAAIR